MVDIFDNNSVDYRNNIPVKSEFDDLILLDYLLMEIQVRELLRLRGQ